MDLGLAQGIYSNKNEGFANGIYNGVNAGGANGIYNENPLNIPIIKSGLVLYLDAGNKYSYAGSGSGILWKDISGNSNNGTLINNPIYNYSNKGNIIFNGSNNYATNNNVVPIGDTSKSVFLWFKSTTTISTRQWLFYSGTETTMGRFALEIENSKLVFNYYNSALYSTNNLITDTWYYVGFTYNATTKLGSLYINGVLNITYQFPFPGFGNINTGNGATNYIATLNGSTLFLNGNISNIQIYNRSLTQSEINQNYQANKSRFGL